MVLVILRFVAGFYDFGVLMLAVWIWGAGF